MMDASWAQASLGDLEASPFTQQQVLSGYADVLERNLEVAVGRVIVPEDG